MWRGGERARAEAMMWRPGRWWRARRRCGYAEGRAGAEEGLGSAATPRGRRARRQVILCIGLFGRGSQ
jgi:hypothetical protein